MKSPVFESRNLSPQSTKWSEPRGRKGTAEGEGMGTGKGVNPWVRPLLTEPTMSPSSCASRPVYSNRQIVMAKEGSLFSGKKNSVPDVFARLTLGTKVELPPEVRKDLDRKASECGLTIQERTEPFLPSKLFLKKLLNADNQHKISSISRWQDASHVKVNMSSNKSPTSALNTSGKLQTITSFRKDFSITTSTSPRNKETIASQTSKDFFPSTNPNLKSSFKAKTNKKAKHRENTQTPLLSKPPLTNKPTNQNKSKPSISFGKLPEKSKEEEDEDDPNLSRELVATGKQKSSNKSNIFSERTNKLEELQSLGSAFTHQVRRKQIFTSIKAVLEQYSSSKSKQLLSSKTGVQVRDRDMRWINKIVTYDPTLFDDVRTQKVIIRDQLLIMLDKLNSLKNLCANEVVHEHVGLDFKHSF
jgi:hypothetical protein